MGQAHPICSSCTGTSIPHGPDLHRAVRTLHPPPGRGLWFQPQPWNTLSIWGASNSWPQTSSFCQWGEKKNSLWLMEDNLTFCHKDCIKHHTKGYYWAGKKQTCSITAFKCLNDINNVQSNIKPSIWCKDTSRGRPQLLASSWKTPWSSLTPKLCMWQLIRHAITAAIKDSKTLKVSLSSHCNSTTSDNLLSV